MLHIDANLSPLTTTAAAAASLWASAATRKATFFLLTIPCQELQKKIVIIEGEKNKYIGQRKCLQEKVQTKLCSCRKKNDRIAYLTNDLLFSDILWTRTSLKEI